MDSPSFNDFCCCCHCCCCCYCYHKKEKRKQKDDVNIPPWLAPPTNDSCCSCPSSINDDLVNDTEPSTTCTTPSDFIPLQKEAEDDDISNKQKKKKIHAIEELLQTERDYVKDLTYLVQVCLDVLSRQQWISLDHFTIIARNSKEILDFHKQFIMYYDAMAVIDNDWSFIAKAFLDQIQQFSLYKHYCDLHAEAWTLTSEYRDKPEWLYFLKDCTIADSYSMSSNKQQKKLHFEDYLIKPVQRICRYQLLIKEIIRYTPTETAEYNLWSSILTSMVNIVTEIDDRKLQRDIQERTNRFVDRIDGDWRINKDHVSQLGNLLIAGAIEVTYSALGQSVSKPRYLGCFVFPTYIIMVRPKKLTSYEPKHWFPLRMADFEDLTDEGQKEHSFVVRCKKHTFAFSASCSQEKQLWVKKIQEAIVAAKIEASDENLAAQDFIVSSLPGITSKRSPQSIRLSRSFTNLLDMTIAGNDTSIIQDDQPMSSLDRKQLRRSASATIHFEEIMKLHPTVPLVESPDVTLKKRYSDDYSAYKKKSTSLVLKPRNNSEMYIKPESLNSGIPRRRPSSLDLLSGNSNVIGKFKNNHQNALRVTVDHKLRDVCTQDYLSSRAWHMREKDQSSFSFDSSITNQSSMIVGGNINRSGSNTGSSSDLLKKRKSSSFIRSSASSFSIIIPKRASELKSSSSSRINQTQFTQHVKSECDIDSNISSRSSSFVNAKDEKLGSRRVSQSSQPARRISQRQQYRFLSESPESFGSEHSFMHLERSPSRRKLFVGKVLRRIASLHQKYPSKSNYSFDEFTVKKAASVDTMKKKRTKHEDSIQLQVNDQKEEKTTTIEAFAYASTPPPLPPPSCLKEGNKWKNRLSLMRPTSFIKLNNKNDTNNN